MNKGTLISRIVALGAVTSLIAGFGTIGYNTETGADLASKIEELKNLAISWKNNASAKDQLISQKQTELEALQGKYNSILTLLGIKDVNADETTIENAINSMSDTQTLKDIATALGIDSTASKANILDEIRVMGETITTLKDSIDTLESTVGQLEAEIERLQGEVGKANNAESEMLITVTTAINSIGSPTGSNTGGTDVPSEPGGTEEPGDGEEPGDSLTEEQQALKATMDAKWQAVDTELSKLTGITESEKEAVKAGNYDINSSKGYKAIYVNDKELGMVKYALETALEAYETAKTAYLNSLK